MNLLWLRTEMEKLLTAKPGAQRLEETDLDLIVAFREEHEIGKLLQAIAERRFDAALAQLRALLASKEPEMLILWCVGDLLRQALKSSGRPLQGRFASFAPRRGGWGRFSNPFSTPQIAPQMLQDYSRQEFFQALRAVRRADLGIKSSWKDSKILLEFLLWEIISGKESAGAGALVEEMPGQSAEG